MLSEFLKLVQTARWTRPPPIWNKQLRQALSENLVHCGWGGVLELTDAGRLVIHNFEHHLTR